MNDDLIWDGSERFLKYANTDLQLFKMCIAILCLNGVEQPFKRHQCPFFLPLRRGNPRLRRVSAYLHFMYFLFSPSPHGLYSFHFTGGLLLPLQGTYLNSKCHPQPVARAPI